MASGPLPPRCPSCGGSLHVQKLECCACGTEVSGLFEPCPVCRLEGELRRLFDLFLAARGNIKQVQRELGVSYPTARQRIEEMFRQLGTVVDSRPPDAITVLKRVRAGELSVEEAERILREGSGSGDRS